MGFDLGLAAAAYQGMKAEQRRMKADQFRNAQYDYQAAQMEEQQSRRGLRDKQASLAEAEVTAKTADLTLGEELRPVAAETKRRQASAGLTQAKTAEADAEEFHKWTPERHQHMANQVDEIVANDAVKADELRKQVMGRLWEIGTKEKGGSQDLLTRINAIARTKLFPGLHGKQAASVARVQTPDGEALELRDTTGAVVANLPLAQLKAAHESLNPIKPKEVLKLSDGERAYSTGPDGKVVEIAHNPKKFAPPNPNGGGGGRAGGSAQERIIAAMKAEAKEKGVDLSTEQALVKLKANPEQWAIQLDRSDPRLEYETDPEKRIAIQNENRRATGARQIRSATPTAPAAQPGLQAVSPQSQARIRSAIGL